MSDMKYAEYLAKKITYRKNGWLFMTRDVEGVLKTILRDAFVLSERYSLIIKGFYNDAVSTAETKYYDDAYHFNEKFFMSIVEWLENEGFAVTYSLNDKEIIVSIPNFKK